MTRARREVGGYPAPADGFAVFGGLRLHWLVWGEVGAPVILLVHGARSSAHGTWDATAPDLVVGRRLIAPDHRGHGESEWDPDGRYTMTAYVDDMELLLDHLALRTVDLIGHSMGGRVGLLLAARHPSVVRRLVMVDYGPSVTPRRVPRAMADPQPLEFNTRAEAESFVRCRFPEAASRRSLGYGLVDLPDGRVGWRADVAGLTKAWQRRETDPLDSAAEWDAVRGLTTPTLVLRGGRSSVLSAESAETMRRLNDGIRVVDYPAAGHWLHQDKPGRFADDVRSFLELPTEGPVG